MHTGLRSGLKEMRNESKAMKCRRNWINRAGEPTSLGHIIPTIITVYRQRTLLHTTSSVHDTDNDGRRRCALFDSALTACLNRALLGFFKGTSADQDRRFSDKELKLLKSMKFPPEFEKKVHIRIPMCRRDWLTYHRLICVK